jgi:hypothetical protein
MARRTDKRGDDFSGGMVIRVNETWRMVWDGLQFCVQEKQPPLKSGPNKGVVFWTTRAYCRTPDCAIIFLAQRRIFAIKGEYGIEALAMLGKALDDIKTECLAAVGEAVRCGGT